MKRNSSASTIITQNKQEKQEKLRKKIYTLLNYCKRRIKTKYFGANRKRQQTQYTKKKETTQHGCSNLISQLRLISQHIKKQTREEETEAKNKHTHHTLPRRHAAGWQQISTQKSRTGKKDVHACVAKRVANCVDCIYFLIVQQHQITHTHHTETLKFLLIV